jgi:hypothetical protein
LSFLLSVSSFGLLREAANPDPVLPSALSKKSLPAKGRKAFLECG